MSYLLEIGTFDLGNGFQDYADMISSSSPRAYENLTTVKSEQIRLLNQVEESIASTLAQRLDVICLQNFTSENRKFIKTLKEKNFSIFYATGAFPGTAVAVKNNKFNKIQNISATSPFPSPNSAAYEKDIAAVNLTLPSWCPLTVMVSSLFCGARDGSNYLRFATTELNKYQVDCQLIGGNFNREEPPSEFADYTHWASDEGTQVFRNGKAKVDYFFLKFPKESDTLLQKIWKIFTHLFVNRYKFFAEDVKVEFSDKFDRSCSTHTPVFTTIKISWDNSVLNKIMGAFKAYFLAVKILLAAYRQPIAGGRSSCS